MNDAIIRARFGLDISDLRKGSSESKAELETLNSKATSLRASVALLERQMASGTGATELKKQHRELRQELVLTEQQARKTAKQLAAINAPLDGGGISGSGGGHGDGNARMRGQELGHVSRSIIDSLSAGQGVGQSLGMEVPRVAQAFGGGLGSIALIGGLASITSKLVESQQETKKLQEELNNLGLPLAGGKAASIEAITERLNASAEVTKKLEAAQASFFHVAAGSVANAGYGLLGDVVSGNGVGAFQRLRGGFGEQQNQDDEALRRGSEERARNTKRLADKERAELEIEKRANNGDDNSGIDRIRQKSLENQAAIHQGIASGKYDAQEGKGLIKEDQDHADEAERMERRRTAATRAQIAAEEHILAIKRSGGEVEIETAKARVAAAMEAYKLGPQQGNEGVAAWEKVHAAQEEQRIAERTAAERKEELEIRTAVAALTDNADQRHLLSLAFEEQRLKSLVNNPQYSEREKDGFRGQLLSNADAQRSAYRARVSQQNAMAEADLRAALPAGMAGRRQDITNRQLFLGGEIDANTKGYDLNTGARLFKEPARGHEQLAEAAQLQKQLAELDFSEKERLRTIELQTRALKEQGFQLTGEEKKRDLRDKYQQDIDRANQNGDPKTAKAKEAERDAALANIDAEESKLTPAQKRARDNANKAERIRRQQGGKPHAIDPTKGEESFTTSADGPGMTFEDLEQQNKTGFDVRTEATATAPSPEDAAAWAALNATGPTPEMPTPEITPSGGETHDNADVVAAIHEVRDYLKTACTATV